MAEAGVQDNKLGTEDTMAIGEQDRSTLTVGLDSCVTRQIAPQPNPATYPGDKTVSRPVAVEQKRCSSTNSLGVKLQKAGLLL